MKYTIWFKDKVDADTYDKVYKVLDLVLRYALTDCVLHDGTKPEDYVLESDDDAECELDRVLEVVSGVFGVELYYESTGDEGDEE